VETLFSLHTRDAEAFFVHREMTPGALRVHRMPQLGHRPGSSLTISACIGHA
jgi:hypothetical protein